MGVHGTGGTRLGRTLRGSPEGIARGTGGTRLGRALRSRPEGIARGAGGTRLGRTLRGRPEGIARGTGGTRLPGLLRSCARGGAARRPGRAGLLPGLGFAVRIVPHIIQRACSQPFAALFYAAAFIYDLFFPGAGFLFFIHRSKFPFCGMAGPILSQDGRKKP